MSAVNIKKKVLFRILDKPFFKKRKKARSVRLSRKHFGII